MAEGVGDGPSMLLTVGNWVVWGWVTVYDDDRNKPAERLALPDGVRVAVGDPAEGLAGFVQSHQEARGARRVASLLGRRAGTIVRHHRVSLLALLSTDPRAAASFVEAELGELAGPSDSAVRLRATLRIYLEENSSPARTSRRLSVNKNTVVYRVNKAEEMLGHPVAARRLGARCGAAAGRCARRAVDGGGPLGCWPAEPIRVGRIDLKRHRRVPGPALRCRPDMHIRAVDHLLVGGGVASATCASELRALGAGGSILVVGRETEDPYHRPPMTKGYLRRQESRPE